MEVSSIVALGSLLIALISVIVNFLIVRGQQRSKNLEARRAEIYKKLNSFYGPMMQLRHKSKQLHDRFKNGENFRTLPRLLEEYKFKANDKVLIDEIIDIGEKCENLIQEASGLIDEKMLRTVHLPKASKHFFIIRMAHQGKLKQESERFSEDVFPTEIDHILEIRFEELQNELDEIDRSIRRFSMVNYWNDKGRRNSSYN